MATTTVGRFTDLDKYSPSPEYAVGRMMEGSDLGDMDSRERERVHAVVSERLRAAVGELLGSRGMALVGDEIHGTYGVDYAGALEDAREVYAELDVWDILEEALERDV